MRVRAATAERRPRACIDAHGQRAAAFVTSARRKRFGLHGARRDFGLQEIRHQGNVPEIRLRARLRRLLRLDGDQLTTSVDRRAVSKIVGFLLRDARSLTQASRPNNKDHTLWRSLALFACL